MQVLSQQPYGQSCDIWSAGVVLYMLLCGRPPFRGSTKTGTMKAVKLGASLVFLRLVQLPVLKITDEREEAVLRVLAGFGCWGGVNCCLNSEKGAVRNDVSFGIVQNQQVHP